MSNEPNPSSPSPSGAATQAPDPHSVEAIFIEALSKPLGEARSEFVETACQGNTGVRARVEALLRAHNDAGSFLNRPVGDWRNPAVTAGAGPQVSEVDEQGIPHGLLKASEEPGVLGTIGPYQVRELIGRGGMGIVLRAFDAKLNRIVAVKVLAPELAAQPMARRRFLREAQAAAAVSHPHVVTIHAVDEDRWPYLVMECIEGCSLQDKIERAGTLKLTEVLRIGTQIAEGLTAAHKQGLIHRDVKPANILLENGVERVKITDFGLARAADDVTITRPGEISGTPQYMSPEQASGERVDQRSDLFSLGCVLYAMCAGQPPFRADSMAAIVKKICHDAPQPLREIDQQLPEWLAETIDRLLAKDPNQRFQTANEVSQLLGDALARLQAGLPFAATVAQPTEVAAPPRLRPEASAAAAAPAPAINNFLVFNPSLPRMAQWICAYGLVISPVLFALSLASIIVFTLDDNDYVIASEVFDLPFSLTISLLLFIGGLKLRDLRGGVRWLKTGFALQAAWLPLYLAGLAAWMAADPQAAAALEEPGNGRDFISLSLVFVCYGFGIFALVWLMRHSGKLSLSSDALRDVAPATQARPALPAWLVVVIMGLAGYWFCRLLPARSLDPVTAAGLVIGASLICLALLVFWMARLRSMPSMIGAMLTTAGVPAFLVAGGIAHDRWVRHGSQFDAADGLTIVATLLVGFLLWRRLKHPSEVLRAAAPPERKEPAARPAVSWTGQPWKVAGWLVVSMLVLALLVPVLGSIALIVPYFQAQQSRQQMRDWQATMGVLKMTFDEDLPIVDIQIDGTSWGPVEISPVERGCSPGSHTVTVIYSHGERKRSVRHTVELAPQETLTLDLTPLVLEDIESRNKPNRERADGAAVEPLSDDPEALRPDDANIAWGRAARQVQLGWRVQPKKGEYATGEIVKVALFLRNTGPQPIKSSMPNREVLEKLGLDVELRDAAGAELPWRWGPGHVGRNELTVSGAVAATLEPNLPFELPPFNVVIGRSEKVKEAEIAQSAMVELDLKGEIRPDTADGGMEPIQPLKLWFKLSSIGYARGDEERLESEAFGFRVVGR